MPLIPDDNRSEVNLRIPFSTILKLAGALLICYLLFNLWPLLLLLLLSALIAATLQPFVTYLEKQRVPRDEAKMVVCIGVIAIITFGVISLLPPLIDQFSGLTETLPQLRAAAIAKIPQTGGLRRFADSLWSLPKEPAVALENLLSIGQMAIG